jgi:large subunit ribosomal protein L18e
MKSKKTRIEKKLKRKTNPELVETIIASKKHKEWLDIGNIISGSRRNSIKVNIEKINKEAEEGDIVVVPGKVLSTGKIEKKVKVAALGFSEEALKKLKEKKCQTSSIFSEIKENPHAKAVRIIAG